MDPSVFFGRSTRTRQALQSKQQTSDVENVNCEVITNSPARVLRSGKSSKKATKDANLISAAKTRGARKPDSRREGTVDDDSEKISVGKVRNERKAMEENATDEAARSGPVYRNVRKSDVLGDTDDVYDFPCDENAAPSKKKKKPRKAISKKKPEWIGTVKWDPFRRPITKAAFKSCKSKALEAPAKSSAENEASGIKIPSRKPQTRPPKVKCQVPDNLKTSSGNSSPSIQVEKQIISTTALQPSQVPSKSVVNPTPISSVGATETVALQKPTTAVEQAAPKKVQGARLNNDSNSQARLLPSSPSNIETNDDFTPAETSSNDAKDVGPSSALAAVTPASSSRIHKTQTAVHTPIARPLLRTLCFRESPSFGDSEPVAEMSGDLPSPRLSRPSVANCDAFTSTPVTRSKSASKPSEKNPTVRFHAPFSSPKQVSPVPLTDTTFSQEDDDDDDANMSGLFDDIPRTSVIPKRTSRGTIFVPQATKDKFLTPLKSSGLDDCFGFDEEDSSCVPQRRGNALPVQMLTRKRLVEKPSLSIQEIQAALRGYSKVPSSPNVTPRSVQTKLTDFVSSTPARAVAQSKPVVITPTPVPLFDEEHLERELPSPYIQPSRRSYDRLRPAKRIACGDEVHSDDDEQDEDFTKRNTTEPAAPEVKKKNRSYRKRKKPQDVQLDMWANELTSHFNEVEETELQVE